MQSKIYIGKSELHQFMSSFTMSTYRKVPVSYDAIIDQQFRIEIVYSKAVKIRTCFSSLFKKGAIFLHFVPLNIAF